MVLKKLDKISFVPVLNGSVLNCALRDDLFIDGKRSTFYTVDGIYDYPIYLINPFHHADLFKRIKEKKLLREGNIVVSDSGGLQQITLNQVKHEPDEVFRWQQEYTNIGFSVDSLPFITPKDGTSKPGSFGGWKFDKVGFLKHAEKSKNNIEVTKKYRDRKKYPEFYFYGIIQGRGYNEYKQWYDIIRDEYLDGYCCKAPNINPITLAETTIFAANNIVKPIHFLGIGNISRSIVLYYASKYIKQPITFDSSSYDIGTQYRSYLLPFLMNKKLRFVSEHNMGEDSDICNQNDVVYFEDATKLCDCVVCRAIGNKLGKMIRTNDPILGGLISVHNLILNIKYINYIKCIIDNNSKLEEFVKSSFEETLANKILIAFKMIDMNNDKGPEYTFHYFRDKIQNKNKEEKCQSTIFGF